MVKEFLMMHKKVECSVLVDTHAVRWWENHGEGFSTQLQEFALRLLRFVPNSCGTERSVKFSKGIKTKLRNRTGDKKLEALTYLTISKQLKNALNVIPGFDEDDFFSDGEEAENKKPVDEDACEEAEG